LSRTNFKRHKKQGCDQHNKDRRQIAHRYNQDQTSAGGEELAGLSHLEEQPAPLPNLVDAIGYSSEEGEELSSTSSGQEGGGEESGEEDPQIDALGYGSEEGEEPGPISGEEGGGDESLDEGDEDGEGGDEDEWDERVEDEWDEDEEEQETFSSESDEDESDTGAGGVGMGLSEAFRVGGWEHDIGSNAGPGPNGTSTEARESPYDVQRRDAKFYLTNLQTPLYPGCKITVIGACYVLANEKVEGRMSDKSVDRMCRYMSDIILPKGNLHPPSLYLLKKCLKVQDADSFEVHVCIKDCHRFPKLRKSQYHNHLDDKCPKCQHPRFKVVQMTNGTTIKPYKMFWDLGLASTLQESFFSRPEFCEQRGTGRDKYDTDFYKSEEAQRLDESVGGALMKADNSAWELGFDFFQPYTFKTHSTGVVGIRYG
jgi:ssDNA-binding Zn-finger/Zn-ribbon topoisomerase 1